MGHPLSTSLINSKFFRFGFFLFILSFLFYSTFLGIYTAIVFRTQHPQFYYNLTDFAFEQNLCQNVTQALGNTSLKATTDTRLKIGMYCFFTINVFKNLFAIILHLGTNPKKIPTYILEISSLILSYYFNFDDQYQKPFTMRCPLQWEIGAAGLFVGYTALFYYIQYIPIFGIYVLMIRTILIRFLLFLPVLMVLVCAFALSFFMIFQNFDAFGNVGISLAKISTDSFLFFSSFNK
jgi:hypothetical protein